MERKFGSSENGCERGMKRRQRRKKKGVTREWIAGACVNYAGDRTKRRGQGGRCRIAGTLRRRSKTRRRRFRRTENVGARE